MPEVAVQDAVEVLLNNRHLGSTLTFRLTQEEEVCITALAETEGRTLSSMLRKLIKDGKMQKEHSPRSVDTSGRHLADGMPIRLWLAGHILAGNQISSTDLDDPKEFAKNLLRLADAVEAEAFKGA